MGTGSIGRWCTFRCTALRAPSLLKQSPSWHLPPELVPWPPKVGEHCTCRGVPLCWHPFHSTGDGSSGGLECGGPMDRMPVGAVLQHWACWEHHHLFQCLSVNTGGETWPCHGSLFTGQRRMGRSDYFPMFCWPSLASLSSHEKVSSAFHNYMSVVRLCTMGTLYWPLLKIS